jgi:polyhydroxybutyrate depolymerase
MRTVAAVVAVIIAVAVVGIVTAAGHLIRLRASLRAAAGLDEKRTIVVGSSTRQYLLHLPESRTYAGKRAPLVLVFHGGGGHAWNMPGFTHFDELADERNFIVAYPDSVAGNWNDGREIAHTDDVAFVRALIDELEHSYPIDPQRVYATGISNGGFFSNRLACELTGKIAAVASVAATIPEPLVPMCGPSRPISVMYIHGTEDPLVPIDGGQVGFKRARARGYSISLAAAARFWRGQDQISSAPSATDLRDQVSDGTHVHREIWAGGKDGSEVVVYTIQGGGHTWPSGPQYLPKLIVGKASGNLDATRIIWEFFQSHALP